MLRHMASADEHLMAMRLHFPRERASAQRRAYDRDEIKGKAEKAKGYVKDKAGEILNNPDLEADEAERVAGTVREGYGKAKRTVREGIEDIADEAEQQ